MTDVFKLIEDHGLTLHGDIEHFAELVRADEREACVEICDGISEWYETRTDLNQTQKQVGQLAAEVCGVRIRERGDAIDISQERVDETAKRKHEWVGLGDDIPGLGLVTEEFYNGMLCAEDILRKRNT